MRALRAGRARRCVVQGSLAARVKGFSNVCAQYGAKDVASASRPMSHAIAGATIVKCAIIHE